MQDAASKRVFKEGERVRVVGPAANRHADSVGIVRSATHVGSVYRYLVEFDNGRSDTFFGFELNPTSAE